MSIHKSYYAIIPANVRYDKDLKPNAKLLYGEITALCNERGYCWATNAYFGELYGVGKETVSRWISQLEKKGYIKTVVIRDEQTNEILERRIYIATPVFEDAPPIVKKDNTPPIVKKSNTPIVKKSKDNSTEKNTKEEEEEKGIFKNSDEALIFAKGFLKAKIKHDANYEKVCNYIEAFIDDMKSLRETSIKSYCLKILEQHDKEPALEQEQPKQPKQKRTYPKKNARTEVMPLYDNEPIQRTPEEEQAELARIEELMADMI